MSEKCKTCDGIGSVPAEVETAEGPMPCPYIGAPCPDCSPMPEKLITVRESVQEALQESGDALRGEIAYALTKRLVIDMPTARAAVDEAFRYLSRDTLAKSEGGDDD